MQFKRTFKGPYIFILKFKNFQGACKPCRFLVLVVNKKSLIKLHETLFVMYFFFVFALVVDLL